MPSPTDHSADNSEERLRYRWRRTWQDHPRDFSCELQSGEPIGRIYFVVASTSQPAHWQWFVNGEYRSRLLNSGGRSPGRLEAARAVEEEYDRVRARIDDMTASGESSS